MCVCISVHVCHALMYMITYSMNVIIFVSRCHKVFCDVISGHYDILYHIMTNEADDP